MKRLIAGNWKMFGLKAAAEQEVAALADALTPKDLAGNEVLICPPATLLGQLAQKFAQSPVVFGGQNCHAAENGAFTGEISAEMLADSGATYCIVGHSERRQGHQETNKMVKAKAEAAHRAGLTAIVCVGETRGERVVAQASSVVSAQIEASMPATSGKVVVAYEPIWAIGTGLTPTVDDLARMHGALRQTVGPDIRILYGGSVKPGNAAELLNVPNVNGALVGGASLKATDLYGIISA